LSAVRDARTSHRAVSSRGRHEQGKEEGADREAVGDAGADASASGAIAEQRGDDPEIRRQVVALIQSLDNTLSDEFVLEELKALKEGGPTFSKVFAKRSGSLRTPSLT
jgi:hypothetical protein